MSSMRYIVFIVSANVEVLADAKCNGVRSVRFAGHPMGMKSRSLYPEGGIALIHDDGREYCVIPGGHFAQWVSLETKNSL